MSMRIACLTLLFVTICYGNDDQVTLPKGPGLLMGIAQGVYVLVRVTIQDLRDSFSDSYKHDFSSTSKERRTFPHPSARWGLQEKQND